MENAPLGKKKRAVKIIARFVKKGKKFFEGELLQELKEEWNANLLTVNCLTEN